MGPFGTAASGKYLLAANLRRGLSPAIRRGRDGNFLAKRRIDRGRGRCDPAAIGTARATAGWEVFVAEYEGALLGFAALNPAGRRLDQLFIAPDAKRPGIGRKLFDLARTVMPEGFWLRTAAENKEARAFCEAVGMTLDRTEPHPQHHHDTAVYIIGNPSAEHTVGPV